MGREVKRVAPGADWQRYREPFENKRFKSGTWYQMWQTVSDKPYTPAFETPEELARWCADHPWGAEVDSPVSYEAWMKFIKGPGWAPSMIASDSAPKIGVQAIADKA
ncbi:MAG TPA: hypothetical protein VFM33_13880 [Aquabacterium sp.]|nr:hypothetical protein [Aquabacterium sp.]